MKRGNLLALLTAGHVFEHWHLGLLGPLSPFLARDLGLSFTGGIGLISLPLFLLMPNAALGPKERTAPIVAEAGSAPQAP